MNRYRWRTFVLELVMVAAAAGRRASRCTCWSTSPSGRRRTPPRRSGRPPSPTLDNFSQAWQQGGLGGALINSVLVTVVSVIIVLAVSSLAAYPLARATARWSRGMFLLIMLGLLLPFQLAALPLYQTMRDLGLLGTRVGAGAVLLRAAGAVHHVPLHRVPAGAAARLRGRRARSTAARRCRPSGYVVFPMLKPITVTALVLNAVAVWNDFFTPLLYLSAAATSRPCRSRSPASSASTSSDWNLIFAALVISIVPILAVYFALQRSIINGFAGGLKG